MSVVALLAVSLALTGPAKATTFYDFKMQNIDGRYVNLKRFKGNVVMVVNVASFCGNTPQYKALESLYETYKGKGFTILGFPANEFGQQEPGSNKEIKEFCTSKYKVAFPMFSKIVVKGENTHPLYKWLIDHSDRHDDIEWNFAKFLVGRNGEVVNRFAPKTQPDSAEVTEAVEKALAAK